MLPCCLCSTLCISQPAELQNAALIPPSYFTLQPCFVRPPVVFEQKPSSAWSADFYYNRDRMRRGAWRLDLWHGKGGQAKTTGATGSSRTNGALHSGYVFHMATKYTLL
ncbi:hypothetical protein GDO78_014384 [Eleutherodactylus coqui]|uniref:Uncharacterized protein n=1 Tax=Eleutherodactylus coqui TaxID=57060 RepID=A0A8J6BCB9_ELECQ|nr:hypothetical protein GDO78_014384 [Eleutherodactylus coqui]